MLNTKAKLKAIRIYIDILTTDNIVTAKCYSKEIFTRKCRHFRRILMNIRCSFEEFYFIKMLVSN